MAVRSACDAPATGRRDRRLRRRLARWRDRRRRPKHGRYLRAFGTPELDGDEPDEGGDGVEPMDQNGDRATNVREDGGGVSTARRDQEQEREGDEYGGNNIYGGSGWGLEVLSLQRDWAHVEWSAELLVPESGREGLGEAGACVPSRAEGVGWQDGFVFCAAAIAEVR